MFPALIAWYYYDDDDSRNWIILHSTKKGGRSRVPITEEESMPQGPTAKFNLLLTRKLHGGSLFFFNLACGVVYNN